MNFLPGDLLENQYADVEALKYILVLNSNRFAYLCFYVNGTHAPRAWVPASLIERSYKKIACPDA